jgi:hypothetical protein
MRINIYKIKLGKMRDETIVKELRKHSNYFKLMQIVAAVCLNRYPMPFKLV